MEPEANKIQWIPMSGGRHPVDAFVAGNDSGNNIYVIRAFYQGAQVPGKLCSSHPCAHIPYGCKEQKVEDYEVSNSDGEVPSDAVEGGYESTGEIYYIGRVQRNGGTTVGKIHPSQRGCYVPYYGKELYSRKYEVLQLLLQDSGKSNDGVLELGPKTIAEMETHRKEDGNLPHSSIDCVWLRGVCAEQMNEKRLQNDAGQKQWGNEMQWIPMSGGRYPKNAFKAGSDSGSNVYVVRAFYQGNWVPGKLHAPHPCAFIPYEVLVAPPSSLFWVSNGAEVPLKRVKGGTEKSGETNYIGRVTINRAITVGKIVPSLGVCYVPYNDKELRFKKYEVLQLWHQETKELEELGPESIAEKVTENKDDGNLPHTSTYCIAPQTLSIKNNEERLQSNPEQKQGFDHKCQNPAEEMQTMEKRIPNEQEVSTLQWIPMSGGQHPDGAFVAGSDFGNNIFVIRALHQGSLVPGKLHASHPCAYIPYDSKEVKVNDYEGDSRTTGVSNSPTYTAGKETFYIGRVRYKGAITVGRICPSLGVCYVPFHGKEMSFEKYDVLQLWNDDEKGLKDGAVGFESKTVDQEETERKVDEDRPGASIARIEIGTLPLQQMGKKLLPNLAEQEELVDRASQKAKQIQWIPMSGGRYPKGAFVAGTDSGNNIYVIRASYDGVWVPGKLHASHLRGYIAINFNEVKVNDYEVPCLGGEVPLHAVEGGCTTDGETLYIGLVKHNGVTTVGKIHPSQGMCYIPYEGRELAFKKYEVLKLRHQDNMKQKCCRIA